MPAITFNRFYRHAALTRLLKSLAAENPHLLRLESIGKSHEGREGGTDDRLKMEWMVRAPRGGRVKLTARHERAGVVRAEVELKP